MVPPGLVWGKALRSPAPHARIVGIDTASARALPGVLAVLTARDLPNALVGRRMCDMPVLARDRVRFIGEKVAVVAGAVPDVAEEALALIGLARDARGIGAFRSPERSDHCDTACAATLRV